MSFRHLQLLESSSLLITCFSLMFPFTGFASPCPLIVLCSLHHVRPCWRIINLWRGCGPLSTLPPALSEGLRRTCNVGFSSGKRSIRKCLGSPRVGHREVCVFLMHNLRQGWRTRPCAEQGTVAGGHALGLQPHLGHLWPDPDWGNTYHVRGTRKKPDLWALMSISMVSDPCHSCRPV